MFTKSVYIVLFVFFFTGELSFAQALNDSVFQKNIIESFQLKDPVTNKITTLKKQPSNTPLIAYVFISPECPLCQNYMPLLNALHTQFGQTVEMIGIIPGKTYSLTVVSEFKKKYKGSFSLYIDAQKKMTTYLHASITPEVIVLNNEAVLVYKGAIDNRLSKLGEMRTKVCESYFSDAIVQYQHANMVTVKRRKAIGCTINDF